MSLSAVIIAFCEKEIGCPDAQVFFSEISDGLNREDSHKNSKHGGCITFSKIATPLKQDIGSSWRQTPVHEGNCPGAALLGISSRCDESIFARLHSGHTRAQRYVTCLEISLLVHIAM
ncbi:hypothetical protein TNCV_3862261 [Trichonephila clavipes]|nr:hypothetical protein TNCV_3862261 [Trichonephila clavipes]